MQDRFEIGRPCPCTLYSGAHRRFRRTRSHVPSNARSNVPSKALAGLTARSKPLLSRLLLHSKLYERLAGCSVQCTAHRAHPAIGSRSHRHVCAHCIVVLMRRNSGSRCLTRSRAPSNVPSSVPSNVPSSAPSKVLAGRLVRASVRRALGQQQRQQCKLRDARPPVDYARRSARRVLFFIDRCQVLGE